MKFDIVTLGELQVRLNDAQTKVNNGEHRVDIPGIDRDMARLAVLAGLNKANMIVSQMTLESVAESEASQWAN